MLRTALPSLCGVRYCATECSAMRSNDRSGSCLTSSGAAARIFGLPAKRAARPCAHAGRAFAQQQFVGSGGDNVGVQCLAAAIVEYARLRRRHQRGDCFRDDAVMNVLVTRIDVDRMRTIPECKPVHVRHNDNNGPSGPNAGSVAGSGTLRMLSSALVRSAFEARQRLYLPLGG